jgi:hypothetical protein
MQEGPTVFERLTKARCRRAAGATKTMERVDFFENWELLVPDTAIKKWRDLARIPGGRFYLY